MKAVLARRHRRRMVRMMRGFRRLRQIPNGLELMTEVKERLSRTPFSTRPLVFSAFQLGAAQPHGEQAVRQFLTLHVATASLHRAVLRAYGAPGGKLAHPLPASWRTVVAAAGVPISHWRCRALWAGFLLVSVLYGWLQIARTLGSALAPSASARQSLAGMAFFMALPKAALPAPGPDGRSFDVITWYAGWAGRREPLTGFAHTVIGQTASDVAGRPVRAMPSPVPVLDGIGQVARLAAWSLGAVLLALVDLLRGRWWHALLLSQTVMASRARVRPGALAADYLFHNSGWLFRPLWTYEAERQGSRILFYFYSTNIETFKYPDGYPLQAHTWHIASWPHYVVWDDTQAAFVRRNAGADVTVDIVGPIWFQSSGIAMPDVPAGAVAVFNVSPIRDSAYQTLLTAKVYYTPEVVNAFMHDVREALVASGHPMVFKPKRRTEGHFIHGKYRRAAAVLVTDSNCIPIDPDIAAWRVVESCWAVISMPFTSTALIGRAQGKPSIYYVPHYAPFFPVQRDDRAAHGIPIVVGPDELRGWLASVETVY